MSFSFCLSVCVASRSINGVLWSAVKFKFLKKTDASFKKDHTLRSINPTNCSNYIKVYFAYIRMRERIFWNIIYYLCFSNQQTKCLTVAFLFCCHAFNLTDLIASSAKRSKLFFKGRWDGCSMDGLNTSLISSPSPSPLVPSNRW